MLGTRATRLLDEATKAIATGGTAMVMIRGISAPQPLHAFEDMGDGLISIDVDANVVVGRLFVFEDDIVAVVATPFQDPA